MTMTMIMIMIVIAIITMIVIIIITIIVTIDIYIAPIQICSKCFTKVKQRKRKLHEIQILDKSSSILREYFNNTSSSVNGKRK